MPARWASVVYSSTRFSRSDSRVSASSISCSDVRWSGEAVHLADVDRLDRLAQLHLGEKEAQQEGHERDGHRDEEDDLDRVRDGVDVLRVEEQPRRGRLELGQHARIDRLRVEIPQHRCRDLGQRRRDRVVQDDGVDRPEHRRAERAADHAEEHGAAGRHAEVLVGHGVLHRDDEDLHDEAHADTEDEHVAGQHPAVRRGVDQRQQVRADGHQGGADDREDLVAAPARDEPARDDRRAEHAEHQREDAQPRRRRAHALDDLHVQREEGERPEHGEAHDEADASWPR